MKVMVLNCGSSSVKFKLYDMEKNNVLLAEGIAERIGEEKSSLHFRNSKMKKDEEYQKDIKAENHTEAVDHIARTLVDPKVGIFKGEFNFTFDSIPHPLS